jgi:hypothetical protein
MAYEVPGFTFTLIGDGTVLNPVSAGASAEGIFYGQQFRFVDVTGAGTCGMPTASGRQVGVCQNKPRPGSGDPATIMNSGISMVMASAAITAGADVTTDGTGQAVTAVATNLVSGVALEAASGAGIIIAVLLRQSRIK